MRHRVPPSVLQILQKFYTPLNTSSVILLFPLAGFILLASFLGNLKLIFFLLLEFPHCKYCVRPLEAKGGRKLHSR